MFILGDMVVFGGFFVGYVYYRAQEPLLYATSQALLNRGYGALGTLFLLTSSLLVLCGVQLLRARTPRFATACFVSALALGAGFTVLKVFEYREKLSGGIGLTTNEFFTFYFMLTGIHLTHVLIGLILLVFVVRRSVQLQARDGSLLLVEGAASYWHMVDLLWIVLFPLLYLMHSA